MGQRVYFITEAPHKVKIGIAKHPEARLRNLQTGNPDANHLWGSITGGEALETKLHHRFRAEHIQLEWYYLSPRVWLYAMLHGVPIPPPLLFWVVWPFMLLGRELSGSIPPDNPGMGIYGPPDPPAPSLGLVLLIAAVVFLALLYTGVLH